MDPAVQGCSWCGVVRYRTLKVKVVDVAWILPFGAALCVVWCGTGH